MLEGYKADLHPANERKTPALCMECKKKAGIIWRGDVLYCATCYATCAPVDAPTPNELAQAVRRGLIRTSGALEIARGGKKP